MDAVDLVVDEFLALLGGILDAGGREAVRVVGEGLESLAAGAAG